MPENQVAKEVQRIPVIYRYTFLVVILASELGSQLPPLPHFLPVPPPRVHESSSTSGA